MNNKQPIQNIIVFTNTLAKGGAELQAVHLSLILQEKYKVYLLVFYGNQIHSELVDKLKGSEVEIIYLSGRKLKNAFDFIRIIRKYQIDAVYSFLATTNMYTAFIGKLCGLKYLIGGFRSSRYTGQKLMIQRFAHNHCMRISIANSYAAKEFLSEHGLQTEKLKVIHNVFVPPDAMEEKKENSIPLIVSVGRFVPEKDYDTALQSIQILKNKNLPFQYRIIGYGILEHEIRNKIKDLDLEDCVQILINPTNIAGYLDNSDIFLQTSLFEGTSNAILEAMYAQLPIVATNVGDNSYMVKDNGFLCEVKQVEKIAEKLEVLIKDTDLRQSMGKKSRQIVIGQFDMETFKKKHFQLLNELQQQHD